MNIESDRIWAYTFLDERHGWIAVGHTIMRTLDGGRSWARVYEATGLVIHLRFASATKGWAAIQTRERPIALDGQAPDPRDWQEFLTTNDGGETWQALQSPDRAALVYGDFRDEHHGWSSAGTGPAYTEAGTVIYQPTTLLHTADGGESWRPVAQPCPVPLSATSFSFVDDEYGRVLCTSQGANAMVTNQLFGTSDGGATWEALTPLLGPSMRGPYEDGLIFLDREHGWLSSYHSVSGGELLMTDDGGRTWQATNYPSVYGGRFEQPQFFSPTHGFAHFWEQQDYLIETDDGGATWKVVYPPLAPSGPIQFFDARRGIGAGVKVPSGLGNGSESDAADSAGAILTTVDGGRTWERIASLGDDVQSLSFADHNHGWALTRGIGVGATRLYRTDDGGYHWTRRDLLLDDPIEGFAAISRVDAANGYVATSRGRVLRTGDGGATFDRVGDTGPLSFRAIHFTSAHDGWALGQWQLFETRDGGQTWSPLTFPSPLAGFTLRVGGHGWILLSDRFGASPHARLYSTDDGGITWTQHEIVGPFLDASNPPNLVDDLHGWWQPTRGHLYVTDDGGKTWRWPR